MADIVREIRHDDDGKPVLILKKKQAPTGTFQLNRKPEAGYPIKLEDAWLFSEEKNPPRVEREFYNGILLTVRKGFDIDMWGVVSEVCQYFDLGQPSIRIMAELASLIQEGLDDLVKLPPQQREVRTIGEVKIELVDRASNSGITLINDIKESVPVKG